MRTGGGRVLVGELGDPDCGVSTMTDIELVRLQEEINAAHNLRMDMLRMEVDSHQEMKLGLAEIVVAVVIGAAVLVMLVSLAARLTASFLR